MESEVVRPLGMVKLIDEFFWSCFCSSFLQPFWHYRNRRGRTKLESAWIMIRTIIPFSVLLFKPGLISASEGLPLLFLKKPRFLPIFLSFDDLTI